MKDLFAWVKWFEELAAIIVKGGEQFLIDRAREVNWSRAKVPLLMFGDENIDPFSFFSYLAKESNFSDDYVVKVFNSVHVTFGLSQTPPDFTKFRGSFPLSNPRNALFFLKRRDNNPSLLWSLFRETQSGNPQLGGNFAAAMQIRDEERHVSITKLTQVLFLMKPSYFLPCNPVMGQLAKRINVPMPAENWDSYSDYVKACKQAFPNYLPYEIYQLAVSGEAPPKPKETKPVPNNNSNIVDELRQFKQIILQGPPGTGKTWTAKQGVAELLGSGWENLQGERWDIIQFHPSYNYEDFIRGIQVKTVAGNVGYKTVDRVLLKMAKDALDDSDNDYILIIDEINRANVAAVLGELIYALEYRGEEIRTTYELDSSSTIVLPDNLYIIGTMNTADRTIGQIDYAVRRRFAFKMLLPSADVVTKTSKASGAVDLFNRIQALFASNEYLSPDYNADDVAIGHSYFIAGSDAELQAKMKYQVKPILEEYVKDGVLLAKAADRIKEIIK